MIRMGWGGYAHLVRMDIVFAGDSLLVVLGSNAHGRSC